MDIIDIPRALVRPQEINWDIDWRGQSFGGSAAGTEQVVYNAFPRWIGSLPLVLVGPSVFAWRALRARARGRENLYRVPMVDMAGQRATRNPICSGAGRGAAEVEISLQDGGVCPGIGQILSHDDWPFMVVDVAQTASGFTLSVEMPLRADISDGDEIKIAATGIFRAASDTMGNPAYGPGICSKPRLDLVEYLNR